VNEKNHGYFFIHNIFVDKKEVNVDMSIKMTYLIIILNKVRHLTITDILFVFNNYLIH
jgi:hypothetical protein